MVPSVRTEDLVDASEVAQILGLSHRNTVATYQRRYSSMPKPIVQKSGGKTRLWLRPEIEAWVSRNRT